MPTKLRLYSCCTHERIYSLSLCVRDARRTSYEHSCKIEKQAGPNKLNRNISPELNFCKRNEQNENRKIFVAMPLQRDILKKSERKLFTFF